VIFAVKLYVSSSTVNPSDFVIHNLKNKINNKNLIGILNKDAVRIRYPDMLLNRSHTFVPGTEAYDCSKKFEVSLLTEKQ